jgi:shikimate kinase / 3-dehydroquinate synthase
MATVEGQRNDAAAQTKRPAIVFIGFMGAGKTTAAEAAREAGLDVVEADDLLETELGMPIATFFGRRGEEEFRSLEAAEVGRLLESADT